MAAQILHQESRLALMSRMAEKMFWKVTLPYLKPREKCFFLNGGLRDRGIIFRDESNVSLTAKDMDYNNSSRRFRPLGSRVMALSLKSLAFRTESCEE